MDKEAMSHGQNRTATRRRVLGGVGTMSLGAIAGCLGTGEDDNVPDPITIDDGQGCDQCTMVIENHPGPAGQAHYEEPMDVVGEDRPAQFCSSLCTYAFTFETDEEPDVVYLTDYSTVDYEIETSGDEAVISRHLEDAVFGNVSELSLVVDSDVGGAMGASMIPFGETADVDAFHEEYGGDRYQHDDVTRELVMNLM